MNSYLSDLENIIINAQSGGQSLSFALKPCATEKSVFDKEVNITPLWLIRKQEAERKAKEESAEQQALKAIPDYLWKVADYI